MNVEERRLATFSSWPSSTSAAAPSPSRIAAAGFYFIGPGLTAKCFSCGLEIAEWSAGDIISLRHRALSPQCVFLHNPARADNVPILHDSASAPTSIGCWSSNSVIYKSEQTRLESFAGWPIPFIVRPEALAAAGFYFLRQGDKVSCAFCTGIINRWERGDVPVEEHRRHFPACPFLLGLPVGNVPRDNSSICDPNRFAELGIQPHRGPRHPKFSTVESRLKTFDDWPTSISQIPIDLAQAGFFHESDLAGGVRSDQVRCFHCDGGLRNWEPGDTAWREHARWFPTCPFLLLVKGQRYVDSVQAEYRAHAHVQPNTSSLAHKDTTASSQILTQNLPNLSSTSTSSSIAASGDAPVEGDEGTLEEENRRLRDARQCKICMDAEIGTVLLPCGHLVACVACAPSLLDCPLCRATIKATVRTFLS